MKEPFFAFAIYLYALLFVIKVMEDTRKLRAHLAVMKTDNKNPQAQQPEPRTSSQAVLHRFSQWCQASMSPYLFIVIVSAVIGLLCGLAAFVFKWLLAKIGGIFTPFIHSDAINWWIIVVPVAGIVLTGIFNRYIIHDNPTHGTGRLINDLSHKNYNLRSDLTFSPIIASSVTLGMGGTSGSEGPIAYTGAAIGSNIGRLLGLDNNMLKTLIGCGTSAGIAGIFAAPVGGIMFGLEVIRIKLTTLGVMAVTISCIVSFFMVSVMNGLQPDMTYYPPVPVGDLHILPLILLGIFCGIYSFYYSSVTRHMDKVFTSIRNPWARNVTGGLIVGICLLMFPSMFGVGYGVIGDVLNGNPDALSYGSVLSALVPGELQLVIACIGILFLKCWGVSATNSSGGVGGDFAPTLFAGCLAGYLFACIVNHWLVLEIPVGIAAFIGMAGVMAGAIEAPIMTIFIVLEMTQKFEYALPVISVAAISYVTVKTCKRLANIQDRMIRHLGWFHKNSEVRDASSGSNDTVLSKK